MALATIYQLPHLPDISVHVSLFKDVKNAVFLRQQLLQGNSDFEYAFLDATKIISVNHVLAAVFRAVNDMLHSRLKSRNVHSEIVFSLSPNNNIAEAFRRFGISDSTTNLLAIKIIPKDSESTPQLNVSSHLTANVEGVPLEFNDKNLQESADLTQVRKLYKLEPVPTSISSKKKPNQNAQVNGFHTEIDSVAEMEAVILGIMALKGS